MTKADILRWLEDWRAVEEAERAEKWNQPRSPSESFRLASELIDLCAGMHGWPPREELTLSSEDLEAQESWVKLHHRLAGR
ncbi:MAG: hypothetical protein HY303_12280 [Candidatus Wallbacteria bacterium]|nr:hypothetical protein [Candidatus Wallbacteria bacterium]